MNLTKKKMLELIDLVVDCDNCVNKGWCGEDSGCCFTLDERKEDKLLEQINKELFVGE